jgi:16S rRNA (uracil1498-N3)-methyltransferase
MNFTLQKTVELGVREIYPVFTQRSGVKFDAHRTEKKMRHWRQIVIASCEQCGRTRIPKLYPPLTLSRYFSDRRSHLGIVLDPDSNKNISDLPSDLKEITILVGAEGGLTEEEIALAVENGFQAIRLGPRILRTETAGMTALAAVQTLWGDFG